MELVVITPEKLILREAEAINRLFDEGMKTLHIKKSRISELSVSKLLNQINPDYYNRIVVHKYCGLARQFCLKGVHLQNDQTQEPWDVSGLSVSKTCYALKELSEIDRYDYVFLSPVFDSISQKEYTTHFKPGRLRVAGEKKLLNQKVYAWRGVTASKIPLVAGYGFGGAAVLGAIWSTFERQQNIDAVLRRFDLLRAACEAVI